MRHIEGADRMQQSLLPESLDDYVAADDPVRVIDAYVEGLELAALGFDKAVPKETGRKPYNPADLLKLYVYGYLSGVSSSRRLERECARNIELMWLLKRLKPDFKTIADFRKDNARALGAACAAFVQFCRKAELLGGKRVAIDGSKFKAAASIDEVMRRSQVQRDRARIEERVAAYLKRLDRADEQAGGPEGAALERAHVQRALERLKRRGERLDRFEQAMDDSGSDEHCDTEPQARLMRSGREGTVLGYNVQTAVEETSRVIVHHEVTQEPGDTRLLLPTAQGAQQALQVAPLEVLADAGYANGEHLQCCENSGMVPAVPRRNISGVAKDRLQKSEFRYDAERDCFVCPAGELLKYKTENERRKLHIYERTGCRTCPLSPVCAPRGTRTATRHYYEAAYERSEARLRADPTLMNRRMAIAERPFAVIKQAMRFRRFGCRGLDGAKAEMAIAVLGYNLKQMIERLGVQKLLTALA
jgi:transposase